MSLSISPGEKKVVLAELLAGGEGETPEEAAADLANRVIHAFLDVRNARDMYGVMTFQRTKAHQVPDVYGPWATLASANKNLPAGLNGDRAVLVRIHNGKAEGNA